MDDESSAPIEFTGVAINGNTRHAFCVEQCAYIWKKTFPVLSQESSYKTFLSAGWSESRWPEQESTALTL